MIPPELLTPILEDPADDTRRLVAADWLDDHAADLPDPQGARDRAGLIRVGCELARTPVMIGLVGDPEAKAHNDRRDVLWRRQRELFTHQQPDPTGVHRMRLWAGTILEDFNQIIVPDDQSPAALWRRGFVAEIRCDLADWQEHAAALLAAHPLERVEASDVPGLAFEVLPPGPREGGRPSPDWWLVGRLSVVRGHWWRRVAAFDHRDKLVAGAYDAIADVSARLQITAGDRWPGRARNPVAGEPQDALDTLEARAYRAGQDAARRREDAIINAFIGRRPRRPDRPV